MRRTNESSHSIADYKSPYAGAYASAYASAYDKSPYASAYDKGPNEESRCVRYRGVDMQCSLNLRKWQLPY